MVSISIQPLWMSTDTTGRPWSMSAWSRWVTLARSSPSVPRSASSRWTARSAAAPAAENIARPMNSPCASSGATSGPMRTTRLPRSGATKRRPLGGVSVTTRSSGPAGRPRPARYGAGRLVTRKEKALLVRPELRHADQGVDLLERRDPLLDARRRAAAPHFPQRVAHGDDGRAQRLVGEDRHPEAGRRELGGRDGGVGGRHRNQRDGTVPGRGEGT